MKKRENLLYVITDKNNNRPRKMGNARKCAWTSPHWVNYHIGRNRWNRPGDPHPATNYNVNIINLNDGTMKVISGIAFVESTKNPEVIRKEILEKLGYEIDLETLISMYNSKALVEWLHEEVKAFLSTKGLI